MIQNNFPLISIITITYNGGKYIENAIKSILYQDYGNIEYIIIDGGSKDNTIEIIKKYESAITYWISEPDRGIGDAWNKGINVAKGELIGLLNADDMYHKTAISKAVEAYSLFGDETLLYGTCKFISKNSINGTNSKIFDKKNLIRGFNFVHTTCFVPKKIYDKIGLFDEKFKIAVDGEFLLRCYLSGVQFEQTSTITYMQTGGVSDRSAKVGYFEYLDLLYERKVISSYQLSKQKFIYKCYHPFRKFIKSSVLRYFLRQGKHFMVYFSNMIYNYIPSFTLKNILLRFLGIEIGRRSYIHPKTVIYWRGNLKIGDNTVINPDSILDNRSSIIIGNNVAISHGVRIYTNGHDIHSPYADMIGKGVEIGDYSFIFSNVLVMPGVRLGKGSVVYAGSVVTKDVEPFTVVAGNPAKKIKMRDKLMLYKNDYGFSGLIA